MIQCLLLQRKLDENKQIPDKYLFINLHICINFTLYLFIVFVNLISGQLYIFLQFLITEDRKSLQE